MKWTEERVDLLKLQYPTTDSKILADSLGCSKWCVNAKASTLGIRKDIWWTKKEDAYLVENYQTMTNEEIGKIIGRPITSVHYRASFFGLKKDTEFFGKQSLKQTKYSIDTGFFENIDTYDKAYFLGFILGDGSVSKNCRRLSINIHKKDRGLLEYFKLVTKSDAPIRDKKNRNMNELQVNSVEFVGFLVRHGIIPNKVRNIHITKIPYNLYIHFIMGVFAFYSAFYIRFDVFDADGYITIYKGYPTVVITGSIVTCYWAQEFFKPIFPFPTYVYPKPSGAYMWVIRGIKKSLEFSKFIYKDAPFYLQRKHNKFVEAGLI